MIKTEDRRMELGAGAEASPREVIRITGFDHVGPDIIEHVEDDPRGMDDPRGVDGRLASRPVRILGRAEAIGFLRHCNAVVRERWAAVTANR